jgi:hypothetical protein
MKGNDDLHKFKKCISYKVHHHKHLFLFFCMECLHIHTSTSSKHSKLFFCYAINFKYIHNLLTFGAVENNVIFRI